MTRRPNIPNGGRSALAKPMAVLIAIIWTAAFVVGVITRNWAQLTIVTAPFLAVCGWVFGVAAIDTILPRRRGNGDR